MIHLYQPKDGSAPVKLAFLSLEGITIDLEIGVDPQEQGRIQRLFVDVQVGVDDARTQIPDSKEGLLHGFDYSKVRTCVKEAAATRTYLLETIANRIVDGIFKIPGALTCSVKVSKNRIWGDVEMTSVQVHREVS
jgi:dihydroneopterin aldolase